MDYKKNKWHICGDLKVVGLVLRKQPGYTKFCYFLFEWNSRDTTNHLVRKDWPKGGILVQVNAKDV